MFSIVSAVPIKYEPRSDLIEITGKPVDEDELDSLSQWLWTVGGQTETVQGWTPYDTRIQLVDDGTGVHRDYLVATASPETVNV